MRIGTSRTVPPLCHADEEVDFSKLPMTQAGFIPAADLLEQLRASTAGLLPAAPQPQLQPPQPAQLSQPHQPRPSPQGVQQQQWQRSSPANGQSQAVQQSPVSRYAWQGSPQQPRPSCVQLDAPQRSPSAHAQPPSMVQLGAAAATSIADLLQQLRLSMAGAPPPSPPPPQQPQQTAAKLSTAELLEQLRQPPAVPLRVTAEPLQASEQQQRQQLHAKLPAIPTEQLLQQLRSSAITGPGQQAAQQAQQRADGRLATEELLAALRAAPIAVPAALPQSGAHMSQPAASSDLKPKLQQVPGSLSSAAQHSEHLQQQQRQQPHAVPATADLLQQLQVGRLPAAREQQPAKQQAPATADLLQQLQAAPVLPAAAGEECSGQQPALSTAELLKQLRASSEMHGMSGRLPAQQAQHDRQCGTAGNGSSTAAVQTQPGDISGLLQQLQRLPVSPVPASQHPSFPAAEDVPLVPADAAAAAASHLADQMRSLLQDAQPAAGLLSAGALAEAADGQSGAGSSTEELLALLRRQQESRLGAGMLPAASPAAHGGSDALLAKLRGLAPQSAFTPPRPQEAAAQQPQQPQQVAQRDTTKPASEDQDMPPAKYMRQEEPEGRVAAAFGTLPAAQQAALAPPATPAADGGAPGDSSSGSGGGGVSLAPTAVVSGGQPEAAPSPSGSVPASSAGSPPLVRPAAGTPAALARTDAISPAGSGSGKPDQASSQVRRRLGGWLFVGR